MSATAGSDSSIDPVSTEASFTARLGGASAAASQFWLEGDVLSCACPDCRAPMTIRLWLRLAECRLCGTQVELSEEAEQLAQQLLARRGVPRSAWSDPVGGAARVKPLPVLPPPRPATPPVAPPPGSPPPPAPPLVAEPVFEVAGEPVAAAKVEVVARRPAPSQPAPRPAKEPPAGLHRSLFHQLIAALLSMVFHMLLMILLGLLTWRDPRPPPVFLQIDLRGESGGPQGGEIVVKTTKPEPAGKESIAITTTPKSVGRQITESEAARSKLIAKVDAIVVRPNLPSAPSSGGGAPRIGTLFGGRSPTMRQQVLVDEGGTEQSESAVAAGLRWIAKHQNRDGSWSLDRFHEAGECDGRCGDTGIRSDTAGTALALLPFLGAGFTHRDGEYKDTVARGLTYLTTVQRDDGSLLGRERGGTMYSHGLASIVLCEAYAMTNDSKLRGPAQKAIDFIVAAQHSQGGWRYEPEEPGDLSVVGWQLMALRSAMMTDLKVPQETLEKADRFVESVQLNSKIARFSYLPGMAPSEAMTAEGMLCRLYAGWSPDHPPLAKAADHLMTNHKPDRRRANMYYWYYATQALHHMGGAWWKPWNERMRELLISTQETKGHAAGSWTPMEGDNHDHAGGRLYMTALAVCTLEVYYRHMPLYKHRATTK